VKQEYRDLLFTSDQIVAYKYMDERGMYCMYQDDRHPFFVLNPLKRIDYGYGGASLENIASYQNILIEWDDAALTIKQQLDRADRYGIPYALATHSGGKSVHFIISLQDPFKTLEEYTSTAKLIITALAADIKCANANRLTRNPEGLRGPLPQEVVGKGSKITQEDLRWWMHNGPPHKKMLKAMQEELALQWKRAEQQASNFQDINEGTRKTVPRIYQDMMEDGVLHPDTTSRHDSLVKLGAWLSNNGYEDELEEMMEKAADALGVAARGDTRRLVEYFKGKA
jgi:hypothetical protein